MGYMHYIYTALAVAAGIAIYRIIGATIKWYIEANQRMKQIKKEKDLNDLDGLDDL